MTTLPSPPVVDARTAAAASTDVEDLWFRWRCLVAEFGLRRLMMHLATSSSGWGLYGVDVVSTLRKTSMASKGMKILAPLSMVQLSQLGQLAALNARRNEAIWRMAALFYVSVPLSLTLAGMQGAPEVVRFVVATVGGYLAVGIGLMTVWILFYFTNNWRARQIEAVIELARIERGADTGRTGVD